MSGVSEVDCALRVHCFLPCSRANGPGRRAVIWVQGCTLGCRGCFNPATHDANGGERVPVDELFERIALLGDGIEGLTISGGEPLQQPRPLLSLLRRVRQETGLSALLFTGYRWSELLEMPDAGALMACLDIIIAGRYDASRHLGQGLLGSSNQTVHLLTERYSMADLCEVPLVEAIIAENGEVTISGIEPIQW